MVDPIQTSGLVEASASTVYRPPSIGSGGVCVIGAWPNAVLVAGGSPAVTSSFTPPPPIPPTQRHLWHFENVRHADMSNYLLDFPWNDYCFRTRDPDLAATAVGEVVDSGMRAYIPYSLTTFSPSNPWFDRACSSAISDREGAH